MTWEEVEQAWKTKDASLLVFEAEQVLKRVEKKGDLFEPVLKLKQKLPKLTAEGKESGVEIAAQAEEDAPKRKVSPRPVKRGRRKL